MKTVTALEAKQSFGKLLDMSQREPVIVTKRGRPVSVMLSVEDLQSLTHEQGQITPEIALGLERGIADAQAGRVTPITPENREQFVANIIKNLNHNRS